LVAALVTGGLVATVALIVFIWLLLSGLAGKGKETKQKEAPPVAKQEPRHDEAPAVGKEGEQQKTPERVPPPQAESPAVKPPLPSAKVQAKEFTNTIGMQLRPIAAGPFQMGDEVPGHDVSIRLPFFIAAHKTTQGQFEKVLGRNPSWFSAGGGGKDKVA